MQCAVRFVRRRRGVPETLLREVPEGTTLLDAAQAAGLPLARACGARALCGRCDLEILEGGDRLSDETPDEQAARQRHAVPDPRRLACQARVRGAVTATAGYW